MVTVFRREFVEQYEVVVGVDFQKGAIVDARVVGDADSQQTAAAMEATQQAGYLRAEADVFHAALFSAASPLIILEKRRPLYLAEGARSETVGGLAATTIAVAVAGAAAAQNGQRAQGVALVHADDAAVDEILLAATVQQFFDLAPVRRERQPTLRIAMAQIRGYAVIIEGHAGRLQQLHLIAHALFDGEQSALFGGRRRFECCDVVGGEGRMLIRERRYQ